MRQLQAGGGKAMTFGKSKAKLLGEHQNKVTFADVAGVEEAQGRGRGDHRLPQGPEEVHQARRPHPQGRADDGPAGHRQDAAGARHRRRGGRAVLQHLRLGLRRDVRRRRRQPRARPVRAGQEERALHHLHRRDRRRRPPPRRRPRRRSRRARADAEPAARRDGRLRVQRRRHPRSPPPTVPTCSTRRCCARAASTAASWCRVPTSRAARASCKVHARACRWLARGRPRRSSPRGTPGFSGADLENLVNEAALLAARKDKDSVDMRDFEEAKDKVLMGPERKSMVISEQREADHRLPRGRPRPGRQAAARAADPVHKVTIIPRGPALGVTQQLPDRRPAQLLARSGRRTASPSAWAAASPRRSSSAR